MRRLAGELNRTTAKLGGAATSQEQFVADASHELRTPLTALRLRLENGDTERRAPSRPSVSLGSSTSCSRSHASTRPRPSSTTSTWETSSPAGLRSGVHLAAEHGIHLRSSRDGAVVRAGAARVEQVLDNLLSNAIDASPRGGEITVAARGPELHVIDHGPGLTQEQRARAFDRFWRGGKGPGSGLGLAIAKRMVELDGGEIALLPGPTGGIDAAVRYPVNRIR